MGGYVRNVHFSNITSHKINQGALGIDTDVLYQWRTLGTTKIRKLTPVKDIFLENVQATDGKFLSKLKGEKE